MMEGKTSTGFAFAVDESTLDNMELVEALAEVDSGNTLAITRVCSMVLGDGQKKRLYDHLRTEDGRVPTAAAAGEIAEIFEALGSRGKK